MTDWFRAISSAGFSIPTGTPTLNLVGTKFLATTDGDEGDDDGWYGRPSMVVREGITIMTYKEGPRHDFEGDAIIHQIMSGDYGTTWTAEDVDLNSDPIVGMPTRPLNAGTPSGNTRGPSHGILTLTHTGRILCQMWSTNYSATNTTTHNDGAHQCHSDDGGLNWSAVSRKTFLNPNSYVIQPNTTFFGEGRVVVEGIIYCVVRDYRAGAGTEALYVATSPDDGETWTLIGQISTHSVPGGHGVGEGSLEYVGDGRFITLLRPAGYIGGFEDYEDGYFAYSNDFCETWSTAIEITAAMGIASNQIVGRTIIKTRAHVKLQNNWWRDRVIIICGFTSDEHASTGTRRNTYWVGIIPADYDLENIEYFGPYFPDTAGYDGGYGDFFYNPILDQYVFCSYRAPTSLFDASVKQYNFTLTFE